MRRVVYMPAIPERAFLGSIPRDVVLVPVSRDDEPVPAFEIADLVIPMGWMYEPMLAAFDRLDRPQVVQTMTSGVDRLAGRVPVGVTVCNARGSFDVPVAEWIVGAMLAMQRGLLQARDGQALGTWTGFEAHELAGQRVVIVGHGSIGAAVADRLQPFGVEIVGVARSARDGALGIEGLDAVLPGATIIVNLLPLTGQTLRFFDARRLALLPDGALFVNAGRGPTVDTAALLAEVARGRLRAALDVTDPEPLPDGHPLWSLPNVLVSPHAAGDTPGSLRRAFEFAGDQIRRWAEGEPLQNVIERGLLE